MPSRLGSASRTAQSKSVHSNSDIQSGRNAPVVVVEDCNESCVTIAGRACRSCQGLDTQEMVQCDLCDKWHHFSCVGVNQDVANVSWSCPKCVAATGVQQLQPCPSKETDQPCSSGVNPESMLSAPERQVPRISRGQKTLSEVTEARSETSSILKLKLLKLEEERALEEEEAQRRRQRLEAEKAYEEKEAENRREYLKKKYQLLEQISSRSSSRCSSNSGRIRDWVKDVNYSTTYRHSIRTRIPLIMCYPVLSQQRAIIAIL